MGNLFIADRSNNRVRRVDAATGLIFTVAGTGERGYSGDGGPGTTATLNSPVDIALDGNGNLFIADTSNNVVRRVDALTGTITTVAGTGGRGFEGDGGPATAALLSFPWGVAVDGLGNLFISDGVNRRVRRVDGATGIIKTVAGDGSPGYYGDGGPALEASFGFPSGLTFAQDGSILIADGPNNRVRRVGVAGVPDIEVTPASLTVALPSDGSSTDILTIANVGTAPLNFDILVVDTTGPVPGAVATSGTAELLQQRWDERLAARASAQAADGVQATPVPQAHRLLRTVIVDPQGDYFGSPGVDIIRVEAASDGEALTLRLFFSPDTPMAEVTGLIHLDARTRPRGSRR